MAARLVVVMAACSAGSLAAMKVAQTVGWKVVPTATQRVGLSVGLRAEHWAVRKAARLVVVMAVSKVDCLVDEKVVRLAAHSVE